MAEFESRLDKRYVPENPQTAQRFTIQFGASQPPGPAMPAAETDTVWPFRDSSRGYVVSLGHTSLAVEAGPGYHDFPQFLHEFSVAISACAEIFQPKREMRLGLRYINEIGDPRLREDIAAVINPKLLPPLGSAVQGELLQSFAELRVAETLGTFVIRHGLVKDHSYLLDFDYFSESDHAFDPARAIETVEGFHALIERFFVWSLARTYLTELKQEG